MYNPVTELQDTISWYNIMIQICIHKMG